MEPQGLVYHAGGLGDFVLSLPAIFRVAQAHPELAWCYWGPTERLQLLPGFGPAPPALLRSGHTLWGDAPAPEVRAALADCRSVLAFGGRTAPAWGRRFRQALAVASFPPASGPRVPAHQARQLDALGVPRVGTPWLPAWREVVLGQREPRWLVLHPGSGDPRKNLPAATWDAALAELEAATALPSRLVLGPTEAERGGSEPLPRSSGEAIVCAGLPDLLSVLASASIYLGNDAGATHLTALLGVPTVAVFGPSDPSFWRPLGPRVRVLRSPLPCAPCTAGGPIACPEPRCLGELAPATLVRTALDLVGTLGETRSQASPRGSSES